MTEEIWKDIQGFEGYYQVSNLGRVKSIRRLKYRGNMRKDVILSTKDNGDGRYKLVSLRCKGRIEPASVHRLVASAFLPNPDNLPCVNHKDENPSNNCVENLEWCTHRHNVRYSLIRRGKLVKSNKRPEQRERPIVAYTKGGKRVACFETVAQAANYPLIKANCLRAIRANIRRCLRGEIPYANGFMWRYAKSKEDVFDTKMEGKGIVQLMRDFLRGSNISFISTSDGIVAKYNNVSVLIGREVSQQSLVELYEQM